MNEKKSPVTLTPEVIEAVREYAADKVGAWALLELDDESIRQVVDEAFRQRTNKARERLAAEAAEHVERAIKQVSGGLNVDTKGIAARWRDEATKMVVDELAEVDFSEQVAQVAAAVVAKAKAEIDDAVTKEATRFAREQVERYTVDLKAASVAAIAEVMRVGCKATENMRDDAERLLVEQMLKQRARDSHDRIVHEAKLAPGDVLVKAKPCGLGRVMKSMDLEFDDEVDDDLAQSAKQLKHDGRPFICRFKEFDYRVRDEAAVASGYRRATWMETLLLLRQVGLDDKRPYVLSGAGEEDKFLEIRTKLRTVAFSECENSWNGPYCHFVFVLEV